MMTPNSNQTSIVIAAISSVTFPFLSLVALFDAQICVCAFRSSSSLSSQLLSLPSYQSWAYLLPPWVCVWHVNTASSSSTWFGACESHAWTHTHTHVLYTHMHILYSTYTHACWRKCVVFSTYFFASETVAGVVHDCAWFDLVITQ